MTRTKLLRLLGVTLIPAVTLFSVKARAAAGDLYEADSGSGNIFRFSVTGVKSTFATGLNMPAGIAFDRAGNLFVADVADVGGVGSGIIFRFTPDGLKSTFASGLDNPLGLAFDGSGNLFVATLGPGGDFDGAIYKFTPAGLKSTFASGIDFRDIAFDASGNLFATEGGLMASGGIFKFTPAGSRSVFASLAGESLAFSGGNDLFAADQSGGQILKFTPSGTRSTFASGLNIPTGLAFDSKGNLFVAEGGNHRIVKFTPSGTKTIFASGLNLPLFLAFEPVKEKLRNVSARGIVLTGENVLIGGFILGGNGLNNNAVLVRGIGPSLSRFGITNPLQDPTVELHNASGALIASNNNWQDTQKAQITATGLAPTDARESAIYATLGAGGYTAIVRGINNTTGVALVEIYNLSR